MQCKDGKCSANAKCRFHLMLDPWMQVASCYSTYSLCDHPMNSDETALCQIMMNCNAFSSSEREVAMKILECICNPSSHFNLHMHFNDAYEKMKQIAKMFSRSKEERNRIISSIDVNRTRCLRFIPCKDCMEQLSQNREYMKLLTQEQCEQCKYIMHCRERGEHLLLEAVAGSGKTMLIAYLIAQYVNEGLLNDNILIITHGKYALRHAFMKELDEQLDLVHKGTRVLTRAEKVVDREEHVVYCVDHGKGRLNYIVYCTIDHLIMARLRQVDLTESRSGAETAVLPKLNSAAGRVAVDDAKRAMLSMEPTRFGHIFVDEGHHVFVYERELHLQGQHILEDCSQVRELIEDLLVQTNSSSSSLSGQGHSMLTVFHDDCCQSNTSAFPYPFEGSMVKGRAMKSSIRMPKTVTDQSIPFARNLQGSNEGFTDFLPLNKHAVGGVSVVYENVSYAFGIEFTKNRFPLAISKVLTKLRDDGLLNDCAPEQEESNIRLAVIFPRETDLRGYKHGGKLMWTHEAIAETARLAVEYSKLQPAESIFPGVMGADDVRSHNVVWTWAANMAGLEADVVIMIGDRVGGDWDDDRVSSDLFLAVSRCMYKLIIVAPRASRLAGHYMRTEKEGGVKYSTEEFGLSAIKYTYVTGDGSRIYTDLKIDKDLASTPGRI